MSRVLLGVALLALVIYCVVDCLQTDQNEVRHLPKVAWVLVIVFFPVIGAVAWLLAGRPRRGGRPQRPSRSVGPSRPPLAPDDDVTFLASLDASNAERRQEAEWERDLQSSEERLADPSVEESESEGPDDPRTPRT